MCTISLKFQITISLNKILRNKIVFFKKWLLITRSIINSNNITCFTFRMVRFNFKFKASLTKVWNNKFYIIQCCIFLLNFLKHGFVLSSFKTVYILQTLHYIVWSSLLLTWHRCLRKSDPKFISLSKSSQRLKKATPNNQNNFLHKVIQHLGLSSNRVNNSTISI